MEKTLHINLFIKWFDLTHKGIKLEDYRELTPYWFERLVFDHKKLFKYYTGHNWEDNIYREEGVLHICSKKQSTIAFKPFDTTTISNGYKTDRPQFVVEHKGIEIGTGKSKWGAIKGRIYFIIKHGDGVVSNVV